MEGRSPAEVRAEMSKQVLYQMAQSGDPITQQNANLALQLNGMAPAGAPTAPATQVPVQTVAPQVPPAPQPQVPAPQAFPAQAPAPAPAANPNDPWAAERDANGLIWGKYRSGEEAKKGYFNAVNHAASALDQLNARNQQPAPFGGQPTGAFAVPATLPGGYPGAPERVNPVAQSGGFDEVVKLVKDSEESGDPIDPIKLASAIERSAAQKAVALVDSRLAPMQAVASAEQYMRAKYPESVNHGTEIGNFIQADPIVGPTVRGMLEAAKSNPALIQSAMEYAYTMYMVSLGGQHERQMNANSQVAEEERLQARAAAGFSASPNTGVHQQPTINERPLTLEEKQALNASAAQDGGELRRRAWLGRFLPPEWRTWETGATGPGF